MSQERPVVALTLGDPAGIGPELMAKLLRDPEVYQAGTPVLVGDEWLWEQAQSLVDVQIPRHTIQNWSEARDRDGAPQLLWKPCQSVQITDVRLGLANAAGGASVLQVLNDCLDAIMAQEIDAICFAPLNKHAMKQAGMPFEDELHYFANYLGVNDFFCEFNTLGHLWTSRISSHVPFKNISEWVTPERLIAASTLIYQTLKQAGFEKPRVGIAALNPHGGDGGTCGREEIDLITPVIQTLNEQGFPIEGPYPADTIFLRAQAGELDGIVTLYHDQGQIAIKLMGFEQGVTVQGGLPVPITTPAHGTAYDIAGTNQAKVSATQAAYHLACVMGRTHRAQSQAKTKGE